MSKVFKSLGLKNHYLHSEIEESSCKYSAFPTHVLKYGFLGLCCPFGLCWLDNQFQRYVNPVFYNLLREDTVLVYMDDFIIRSDNKRDGINKLQLVFRSSTSLWFKNYL